MQQRHALQRRLTPVAGAGGRIEEIECEQFHRAIPESRAGAVQRLGNADGGTARIREPGRLIPGVLAHHAAVIPAGAMGHNDGAVAATGGWCLGHAHGQKRTRSVRWTSGVPDVSSTNPPDCPS